MINQKVSTSVKLKHDAVNSTVIYLAHACFGNVAILSVTF